MATIPAYPCCIAVIYQAARGSRKLASKTGACLFGLCGGVRSRRMEWQSIYTSTIPLSRRKIVSSRLHLPDFIFQTSSSRLHLPDFIFQNSSSRTLIQCRNSFFPFLLPTSYFNSSFSSMRTILSGNSLVRV